MELYNLVLNCPAPGGVSDPDFRRMQLLEELYQNELSMVDISPEKYARFNELLDRIMADEDYSDIPTRELLETQRFIELATRVKDGLESGSDEELDSAMHSDLDSDDFDSDLDDRENMRP